MSRLRKASTWYASGLLALIPFAIYPGIDEFTLLPRLAMLQAFSLCFSLYLAFEQWRSSELARYSFLQLSLFWGILALSVLWAMNPFRATYDLAKHLSVFASFYLLIHSFNKKDLPTVLTAHVVAGLIISLIGITEYFGLFPYDIPSTGRPSATFGFRNLAAAYLSTGIPLAFLLRLIGPTAWKRWLGTIGTALMFSFLLCTRARASWVGLGAGGSLTLLLWWWSVRHLETKSLTKVLRDVLHLGTVLPIVVGIGIGFLPDSLQERHVQRFDEKKTDLTTTVSSMFKAGGDRGRFKIWQGTLEQISDSPILGVGLGNWEYAYPRYDRGLHGPRNSPHRPHNDLLWIWSETGTIGLAVYLLLLGALLTRVIGIWKSGASTEDASIAACGLASMIAFLGIGMFSFPWERVPPELFFWLSAAFVWVTSPPQAVRRSAASGWTFLLLPVLLLFALGITIRNIQFDYKYVKAHVAFLRKDYDESGRHAEEALKHGPFEHQAYIMLGEKQYQNGKWDKAEKSYLSALRYHPYFSNAYNGLGLVEFGRGNYEKSLARYEQARDLSPRHFIATYNKAITLERMGLVDSAIVAYRESFNNNHTLPYVNLGAIYRKKGYVDSAIALYKRAANDVVPSAEGWFNLGNIYAEQKEFVASGEAYTRFLELWQKEDSVRVSALEGLSQAYSGYGVQTERRGQLDSAKVAYQNAIQVNPNEHLNWFNLGNLHRKTGDIQQAVVDYQRSISLNNAHIDSYANLGITFRDMNRNEDAIRVYRKAFALAPSHPIVNYNLGLALMASGNWGEAEGPLATFRANWEGDPGLIHFYMGNAYTEAGYLTKAVTEYETFLSTWDGDSALRDSAEGILATIRKQQSP